MILKCSICGGVYNNATPDSMLTGIKPLSTHGECLKCDIVSYVGEFILKIGTEEFNLSEAPNEAPDCLILRPEPAEDVQLIVTRYDDVPARRLPFQLSLFNF